MINLILSLVLFIINLVLIQWINLSIKFSGIIYTELLLILSSFEIIRTVLMTSSGILTLKIRGINRKIKAIIVPTLLFGIGFNIIFLIRLFGFACFAPVYSFLSLPFICVFIMLIIVQEHDNNHI